MRVALLCPGPSLTSFPGPSGYDLLIGVNRAAAAHRVDWWSVGDSESVAEIGILYTPHVWTHDETARRLVKAGWAGRIDTYQRVESAGWPLFSATAALVLAWRLGATELDCWGVDMAGTKDFDGVTGTRDVRDESRWKRERRIWVDTVERIELDGVKVTRHGIT